ncbi:hypothetical protein PVAND_011507 [Polypedilum vanderplanki]|uniref:Uncharacterized protein n=1 Tax=Polypedilum vanderplanki TaxID=319348 RepID=A0A9J6CKB7_POLVA|nr:hypothetical protein PVAND_011507 [Polypedilum vanderplanki]
MDFPVVALIGNEDDNKNILSNIRKIPNDSNIFEYENLTFYIHEINTKYYQTKVSLLPIEDITLLQKDSFKNKLEGILINFNSSDKSFLDILPKYVDFIKSNPVELFILICKKLVDDEKDGITFKCIKDCYHKIDIIELEKSDSCDENEDEEEISNGYDELQEALKCTLWSNVSVDGSTEHNIQIEEEDYNSIENEINNFETLMSQVMQFRSNTSNMSRDEQLNSAQYFAEVFEKLLLQDEDSINLPNE